MIVRSMRTVPMPPRSEPWARIPYHVVERGEGPIRAADPVPHSGRVAESARNAATITAPVTTSADVTVSGRRAASRAT